MVAAGTMMFSSCLDDLDTLPLNETDKTAAQAYATLADFESGLAYIYGSYVLVSQNDPGSSDISVSDAGQSELCRQYLNLQEMAADGLKCVWGDSYITDTQNATWTDQGNSAITAVYTRGMMAITRANEFLRQSSGSSIDGVEALRAEARFVRAYSYWILLDIFGNPPFATEDNIGGDLPRQLGRVGLYEWLETELTELVSLLPATNEYPRVGRGAAQGLLARLYLNAEVYTGTAQWQKAQDAAAAVIESQTYDLCSNYEHLFLQDNGENADAIKEMIFAVPYDRDFTQSWGGTTTLVSASLDDANSAAVAEYLGFPLGSEINVERWNGYHVPAEYVERNFGITWTASSDDQPLGYSPVLSDKRAFLSNVGCTKEYDPTSATTGWRCWKYTSRDSKGNLFSNGDTYSKFSSADFPMMRLAEMYLIYAEAACRLSGSHTITRDSQAGKYIKALRDRAGVATASAIELDDILAERGAELMWEGHRRTDLIRYGYFTSMSFPWPYKGGVASGKTAIPSYRTVYPLLDSDLTENPELKQNTGY